VERKVLEVKAPHVVEILTYNRSLTIEQIDLLRPRRLLLLLIGDHGRRLRAQFRVVLTEALTAADDNWLGWRHRSHGTLHRLITLVSANHKHLLEGGDSGVAPSFAGPMQVAEVLLIFERELKVC
jgi:hypothetical protein